MPDAGMQIPPPGVDPLEWVNLRRQQQIGDVLTQSALTPPSVENYGAMRSRVSPLSGLAKLAEAMMAKKNFQSTAPQYAQTMQQMSGAFGGGQPPSTPPQNPPGAGSQSPGAPPAASGGTSPMNPMGTNPYLAMSAWQKDPEKYWEKTLGPEKWQEAVMAFGSVPGAMQALQAEHGVSGTLKLRPGEFFQRPGGQTGIAPNVGSGEQYAQMADGRFISMPIANSAQNVAQRAGQIAGTEAAQRSMNTPTEIPMGGGKTRLGFPGSIVGTPPALGGGPGSQYGNATPKGMFPQVQMPSAPQAPEQPSATQGAWSKVPQLSIPSTPGQTSDAYTMDNIHAASTKRSALVDSYGTSSDLAQQQLQYYSDALEALPNAETGPVSHWLTENRATLQELGVPKALISGQGTISPTLELNKNLVNAALQGAKAIYGPRMTQTEVKLQKEEMSPSAEMTMDAIRSLIQQAQTKAQYAVQKNQDFTRYDQSGGDPQRFESWYGANRPLTRYASKQNTPPEAMTRLQANPALLPEFRRTFKWDPTDLD